MGKQDKTHSDIKSTKIKSTPKEALVDEGTQATPEDIDQAFDKLSLEDLIKTWRNAFINEWTGTKLKYAKRGAITTVDEHLTLNFMREDEITTPSSPLLTQKGAIAVTRKDVFPNKRFKGRYDKSPDEIINWFTPQELTHIQMARDLAYQLQCAMQIQEPPHMALYHGYRWGDNSPYSYEAAYQDLRNYINTMDDGIDLQMKLNPFYMELIFGLLDKQYYKPKLFTDARHFTESPEQTASHMLAEESMPANPIALHLLFNIIDTLAGTYYYKGDYNTKSIYYWPQIEGEIKKAPQGAWRISPSFYRTEPEPAPASMLGSNGKGYSKFDEQDISFDKKIRPIIDTLFKDVLSKRHSLFQTGMPKNKSELTRLLKALGALKRALYKNEDWYASHHTQYQYYYRYLFNTYAAYDKFLTVYEQVRANQPSFDTKLPQDIISSIKNVQTQTFNKLMALTEIKLNKGWEHVVIHGERVDLSTIFGNALKEINKTPSLNCMKTLFRSKEWCFLQGKIANAVIYYQQHPDEMNQEDFEVLRLFAAHLLQHHNDLIKKDVTKQVIVMGIVFTIVIAAVTTLAIPGGPISHIAAGSVEAALIAECVVGFVHIGHGLHELFHDLKHIETTGKDLPLQQLNQAVHRHEPILPILENLAQRQQQTRVANEETDAAPAITPETVHAELDRPRNFASFEHGFFNQRSIDNVIHQTKQQLNLR